VQGVLSPFSKGDKGGILPRGRLGWEKIDNEGDVGVLDSLVKPENDSMIWRKRLLRCARNDRDDKGRNQMVNIFGLSRR
jgi:hypothetical protein